MEMTERRPDDTRVNSENVQAEGGSPEGDRVDQQRRRLIDWLESLPASYDLTPRDAMCAIAAVEQFRLLWMHNDLLERCAERILPFLRRHADDPLGAEALRCAEASRPSVNWGTDPIRSPD